MANVVLFAEQVNRLASYDEREEGERLHDSGGVRSEHKRKRATAHSARQRRQVGSDKASSKQHELKLPSRSVRLQSA